MQSVCFTHFAQIEESKIVLGQNPETIGSFKNRFQRELSTCFERMSKFRGFWEFLQTEKLDQFIITAGCHQRSLHARAAKRNVIDFFEVRLDGYAVVFLGRN